MKAVAVFPDSRQVKVIEQEDPRLIQPDQVMFPTSRNRDIFHLATR